MYTVIVDKEIILPDYILSNKVLQIYSVPYKEITQELLIGVRAYALLIRSVTKVDNELLDGTYVQFVGSATSGSNHIDEMYCMMNRITVRTAKGSNAIAVCEYVMLCLEFTNKQYERLGIVGYGEIGSRLAQLTHQKGFEVCIYDPFKREEIEQSIRYEYLEFEELLEQSQILTFHVPLHSSKFPTFNMFSQNNVSLVQDSASIIHTCRGSVIEEAIYSELVEQKNCQLYVDVWENEPAINPQSVLYSQLATPHIAGYTITAKQTAGAMISSQLMKHFFDEIIPVSVQNTSNALNEVLKAQRKNQLIDTSHHLQTIAKSKPTALAIEFEKIRTSLELLEEFLVEPIL